MHLQLTPVKIWSRSVVTAAHWFLRKFWKTCLRGGARAARPGEFTERAFLNGKMDLTQAEAVIDLIRARTDLALRSASEQLEGRLGDQIRKIRDQLIALVAHINASIDFPEEGIDPEEGETLCARLDAVREGIASLLATADQGRVLREGVRVVIYGATNAGKSSLLNRLLGYDRVIVSDTHGTTRDTIEESVNLEGVPIRLVDTAGLRDSESELEREGITRTEKSLQHADLSLHIADRNAPKPPHFNSRKHLEVNGRTDNTNEFVILNKSDLPEHSDWKDLPALRLSCATGEGLPQLQKEILARIRQQNLRPESSIAINTRHRDCLRRALECCDRARTVSAMVYLESTSQLILIRRCVQLAKSSASWTRNRFSIPSSASFASANEGARLRRLHKPMRYTKSLINTGF